MFACCASKRSSQLFACCNLLVNNTPPSPTSTLIELKCAPHCAADNGPREAARLKLSAAIAPLCRLFSDSHIWRRRWGRRRPNAPPRPAAPPLCEPSRKSVELNLNETHTESGATCCCCSGVDMILLALVSAV